MNASSKHFNTIIWRKIKLKVNPLVSFRTLKMHRMATPQIFYGHGTRPFIRDPSKSNCPASLTVMTVIMPLFFSRNRFISFLFHRQSSNFGCFEYLCNYWFGKTDRAVQHFMWQSKKQKWIQLCTTWFSDRVLFLKWNNNTMISCERERS